VLAHECNNIKALFRLGKALAGKGELEEAKKELEKVPTGLQILLLCAGLLT